MRLGGAIPLPSEFSNPTSSTVRFTIRLAQSWFFGPARDIGTVTLPPHVGRLSPRALPTFLYTPLGVGRVLIEVRTDHTGNEIVGRCDYQLHLHAPPPVWVLTGLRLQERWLYQVPLLMCAMEGSDLAGAAKPGQTVPPGDLLKTLGKVNSEIWYPQAQIAFSTATDYAIPVIADSDRAEGQLGDLVAAFAPEVEDERDLCLQAWHDRFPGRVGIPVINARSFIESDDTLGVSPQPDPGLYVAGGKFGSGKRGDDLCGSPVRLTSADISESTAAGPVVAMVDQHQLGTDAPRVLAHELGHNLFLGHGNGLDDNRDGRPAGIPGPKRYDEYCDPGWLIPPGNTYVAEDQATPFAWLRHIQQSDGQPDQRVHESATAAS